MARALFPFGLRPENGSRLAPGLGGARHRLHADAEPGQLDIVKI